MKAIAYTALANSATDLWSDFCIDRCIVVDDFENLILGDVDFIDEKTYDIQRRNMELEFTQTDGVGMVLPSVSEKNFMMRLPWFKGLLSPFDFVGFIKKYNCSPVVKDIWGTPHDIIADDIRIIFTKSQFKMYKFYPDWETYKRNFKLYNCTAGKCNEEEDFSDAVINYQMIQTLHDLSDSEIKRLAKSNDTELNDLATDMKTMLKVFGVVPWNTNKTGFQKCLEKYPELLSDSYTRKTLREIKVKLEKDLWSARFQIKGKYTFVVPDLYAFCEHLFKHEAQPKGLLENGEVCCKLFPVGEKLDCLRSPHLYIEHPIRVNTDQSEWFKTDAIYISCHDLISRIVMCDHDGDKLLVTDNETLVTAAERNMKDVVPLFYNMSKAGAEMITPENLYKGITLAYNGGNIGMPSNNITKVWNSANISDEQMKVVKWLVMEVNFTIDYAKTLYKPTRPQFANEVITSYTNLKLPYFFKYAKAKEDDQVKPISDSTVDRIKKIYPKRNLKFNFTKSNIGRFDYRILMNNPNTEIDEEIAARYKKIVSALDINYRKNEPFNIEAVYEQAKRDIIQDNDKDYVIDNIILSLFNYHKTDKKKAFWQLFGDEVYENICSNIRDNCVMCESCKRRFYRERKNQIICSKCIAKGYVYQHGKIRLIKV